KGTKIMSGDAYIFDRDRIIGVGGEIKFQAIPRKVLNMVLPPRGKAVSGAAGGAPPAAAAKKVAAPAPTKKRAVSQDKAKQVTSSNIGTVNARLAGSVVTSVLDIL